MRSLFEIKDYKTYLEKLDVVSGMMDKKLSPVEYRRLEMLAKAIEEYENKQNYRIKSNVVKRAKEALK